MSLDVMGKTWRSALGIYSQPAVAANTSALPPLGGHRGRLTFLAEASGMSLKINNTTVTGDTFAALAKNCRAITGVQSAYTFSSGIDLVFKAGNAGKVETVTVNSTYTVTTEGIDTKGYSNCEVMLEMAKTATTVTHDTLRLDLQPAFDYNGTVTVTIGTSTVVISTPISTITVAKASGDTSSALADKINNSEAASAWISASYTGAGTEVVSNAILNLEGNAAAYGFAIWAMIGDTWYPQLNLTGIANLLTKSLAFPFVVDAFNRLYIQIAPVAGEASVTARIGLPDV